MIPASHWHVPVVVIIGILIGSIIGMILVALT